MVLNYFLRTPPIKRLKTTSSFQQFSNIEYAVATEELALH